MKQKTLFVMFCLAILNASCGGLSDGLCTTNAVSVNTLDGTAGSAVDTRFDYTFSADIDTNTISETNFFILLAPDQTFVSPAGEYEYNGTVCDRVEALPSTMSCARASHCSLDPTDNLEPGTYYIICMTSEITYAAGNSFEDYAVEFVTAD